MACEVAAHTCSLEADAITLAPIASTYEQQDQDYKGYPLQFHKVEIHYLTDYSEVRSVHGCLESHILHQV